MPQLWRIYLYKRSLEGASPEQLEGEFGLPADEIAIYLEATRLCFEKQCVIIAPSRFPKTRARISLVPLAAGVPSGPTLGRAACSRELR